LGLRLGPFNGFIGRLKKEDLGEMNLLPRSQLYTIGERDANTNSNLTGPVTYSHIGDLQVVKETVSCFSQTEAIKNGNDS
jgi:hypothetical protein